MPKPIADFDVYMGAKVKIPISHIFEYTDGAYRQKPDWIYGIVTDSKYMHGIVEVTTPGGETILAAKALVEPVSPKEYFKGILTNVVRKR